MAIFLMVALKRSLAAFALCILFIVPSFAFAQVYGSGEYGSGSYAGVPPTVTTAAASDIGTTSVTLNGSIVDIGTTTPTIRGFAIGFSNSYGATTTESGSFSAGSFATSYTSLACNRTYHFRAYATSINGTGYGSDTTVITSVCITVGSGTSSGGAGSIAGGPFHAEFTDTSTVVRPSTPRSTSVESPHATFTRNLDSGVMGTDVRQLQLFLNSRGFVVSASGDGSPGNETTYFGPATKAALAKYQKAKNITPSSGYLGPKTRAFIASDSSTQTMTPTDTSSSSAISTRNLSLAMEGEDVRRLQIFLNSHGFIVSASGAGSVGHETTHFGNATRLALIKYQKAKRIIPALGSFGPLTRASIGQ